MADEIEIESTTPEALLSDSPQTEQVETPTETGAPQPASQFDQEKFKQELLAEFSKSINPLQAEIGQFRKVRSEFDKLRSQPQQQNQPPKAWADMAPADQQATREFFKHLNDELYKERFDKYDQYISRAEESEQRNYVLNLAHKYAGEDFDTLNDPMGEIFTEYRKRAEMGDQEAAQYVQEIRTTQSGVKALVAEARARVAQTQEAKNGQLQQQQEARAKRAATGVGSTAPVSPQWSADRLPKDRTERMKVVQEQIAQLQGA